MITILLTKIIALLTSIANKPPIWGGVEELTDDIVYEDVINTTDTNVQVYRQGNIVWVNIILLRVNQTITHNTDVKLFSGLPAPYELFFYVPLVDPATNSGTHYRCRVQDDGSFNVWGTDASLTSSAYCQMSFCYICKDENSEVTP